MARTKDKWTGGSNSFSNIIVWKNSEFGYRDEVKMENIRPQMNKNLSINSSEASAKEAADTILENLIHC